MRLFPSPRKETIFGRAARIWPLFAVLLMATLLVSPMPAQQKATNAWPPRQFPITFWCGPPDDYINAEQYRRVGEAGFNVLGPPCAGAATPERNRKILDTAKATGLKAILSDARMPLSLTNNPKGKDALDAIVKDYHRSSALLGYFLTDEPGASGFAGLAEVAAYLKKIDPEHLVYINLLPNYATTEQNAKPSQLGTDTYDQYLDQFINTVKPDVVSYDHYHFTKTGDGTKFFSNLSAVQRATAINETRQVSIPFWQIVLSVEHGPYRPLNENELRYEAMQTLVYGAHGLSYFTYWLPDDPTFKWNNAIMNRDGTPGPLYEPVKKVNREVKTLTKYLYNASVLSTYQSGTVAEGGAALGQESPARIDGPGDLSVGLFRDSNGYLYVLSTNRDYKNSVTTKAVLHVEQHPVEMLDMAADKFKPINEKRNLDGEISIPLTLGPAGAALVRWL